MEKAFFAYEMLSEVASANFAINLGEWFLPDIIRLVAILKNLISRKKYPVIKTNIQNLCKSTLAYAMLFSDIFPKKWQIKKLRVVWIFHVH